MKTEDINKMARALKQVQETFNDTRPGTKQNQKDFDKALVHDEAIVSVS